MQEFPIVTPSHPTEVATNISFPCLYVGIYDAVGIKLDEFNVFADKDLGFLDLKLQPNKEYFVKISLGGRFDYAGFELTVSEATCDAGSYKESATELAVGEQHTYFKRR